MEKIASFTVNHLNLLPGVYVSRKDNVGGNVITTFDLFSVNGIPILKMLCFFRLPTQLRQKPTSKILP